MFNSSLPCKSFTCWHIYYNTFILRRYVNCYLKENFEFGLGPTSMAKAFTLQLAVLDFNYHWGNCIRLRSEFKYNLLKRKNTSIENVMERTYLKKKVGQIINFESQLCNLLQCRHVVVRPVVRPNRSDKDSRDLSRDVRCHIKRPLPYLANSAYFIFHLFITGSVNCSKTFHTFYSSCMKKGVTYCG